VALPRVIPVMDVLGGLVVRAKGGDRAGYQPIKSPLLTSADPVHCALALAEKFGFSTFYVADLDAIMGRAANLGAIQNLLDKTGASFWLDAGYKNMRDAPVGGRIAPVVATETFTGWDNPGDLSRAVVSIDMNRGRILSSRAGAQLRELMGRFRAAGARRFIHMRLDAVGAGRFDPFTLLPPGPGEEWYAAGGVRDGEDIRLAIEAGYAGALVSTALHDGGLGRGDL